MAVIKELVAKAGTYTNKQGEEKVRYIKVGVQMETAKGIMYKIESLPVVFDGWIFERDLQPKEVGHNPIKNVTSDDVPF